MVQAYMEVVESAGHLDSYLGIVQIHMEVVDYPRQPGSYPSLVQIHMEIIEAAECKAARQLTLAWLKTTWRL